VVVEGLSRERSVGTTPATSPGGHEFKLNVVNLS